MIDSNLNEKVMTELTRLDQRIAVLEEENAELREKERGWAYASIRYAVSERKQARMQAARECVEIMAGEYKRLGSFVAAFNTSMCAIKDHFGLGE